MISAKQALLARTMLDMSQQDVAHTLGWAHQTLSKIENGTVNPPASRLKELQDFYENKGVEFLDGDGVRRRQIHIKQYMGREGFHDFMDDVYNTAKEWGGDICVSNVDESNWIKWMGEEHYNKHAERMSLLKNFKFRIMVRQGDTNYIASKIAEYRWFPAEKFTPQSFYAYGDKLAVIAFEENNVHVTVIRQPGCTEGFRTMFDIAWELVTQAPS